MATAATLSLAPRAASVADYLALLKPRVMSLVIFTGLAGIVAAPGHSDPLTAFVALLCIAIGAGASGALNMAYDADIDALMSRTAARPIPLGRISREDALGFGWTLAGGSLLVMTLFVNPLAAGLLAFSIFFYVFVYTLWLKRLTPQNIVIGGLAGALPPAIGWAAVTGSLSLAPLILVLVTFLWTPPHFWALALVKSRDYERAGVPMMPNARGPARTRLEILVYSLLLAPLGVAPWLTGMAGGLYGAASMVLGAMLLAFAVRVYRNRDGLAANKDAMRLFWFTILYLFALFALLVVERGFGLFERWGL